MELFLLLSLVYLILTMIFSADRFIVNAVVFVMLCSLATISMLTANEYLFLTTATLVTATILPFFVKITITDILEILLISLIAVFWLTTDEFVDGYAYSQIWVAIGITIASVLIFSPQNRQYCALLATLLSYAMTYAVGNNPDLTAIVLSITIAWTATCQVVKTENIRIK